MYSLKNIDMTKFDATTWLILGVNQIQSEFLKKKLLWTLFSLCQLKLDLQPE